MKKNQFIQFEFMFMCFKIKYKLIKQWEREMMMILYFSGFCLSAHKHSHIKKNFLKIKPYEINK